MTAHRTHSVVVRPDRWSGTTAELARLLAPVTGVEVTPLTALLSRGPMTVEADMSPEDARRLHDRLKSLGIPSSIRPGSGALSGSEVSEISEVSEATDGSDGGSSPPEPKTGKTGTMMGMKPMSAEEDSGWGQLFPDLAGAPEADLDPPEADSGAHPPPLEELAGESEAALDEDSDHVPPALVADDLRDTLPPADQTEPPEAPPSERTPILGGAPNAAPPEPEEPAPGASSQPASERPSDFDASKLHGLVAPIDEGRPPYEPAGFDDRPEHHPQFAAILSVLAPGAGQVFNGDDDEALDYGLWFWMVKPWIDGVKDAREKAEKINTYWAPRPDEGTFLNAVKYTLAWWVCVGLMATLLIWAGSKTLEVVTREPEPEGPTPQQIANTFDDAATKTLAARVDALDAVRAATDEIEITPQFSMSDEERATRLFSLGYMECKNRDYLMCEQMMKRVAQLKPGFRPALKLQAWASLRRGGGEGDMPEVEEAPTLDEFERRQLLQEMALQGEKVPKVPDTPPEQPDEPAPPDHPVEDKEEPRNSGDDPGLNLRKVDQ